MKSLLMSSKIIILLYIKTNWLVDAVETLHQVKKKRGDISHSHHSMPRGHYGTVASGDKVPLVPGESRVLITGAAGFIGMNLADSLGDRNISVIGVDDFNSYYSPAFKHARAAHLQSEHNIAVVQADVCDRSKMAALITEHDITHVVHLAAQAGVRYSFKHRE